MWRVLKKKKKKESLIYHFLHAAALLQEKLNKASQTLMTVNTYYHSTLPVKSIVFIENLNAKKFIDNQKK
jgi:hypothetical protein